MTYGSPYGSPYGSETSVAATSSIAFTFSVEAIHTVVSVDPTSSLDPLRLSSTGALKASVVFNQYDEMGLIVGVKRLPGEKNFAFKRRIADAYAWRANSTYQGMVHAITRELGLSLFQPIVIQSKTSQLSGAIFATDPYLKFDGAKLYLYSDYANNTLDLTIDRFNNGGNYEHLGSLVDFINSGSTYFEAWLTSEDYRYTRSMTILNQSDRERITEAVEPTGRFKLKYPYVVSDTIFFSDRSVFKTEVATDAEVLSAGQFFIDYQNGIIHSFLVPEIGTTVRYDHHQRELKPWASNVILHDVNQESFKIKMFEQVSNEEGLFVHGIPTELGVDIINELLSITPMYWGA